MRTEDTGFDVGTGRVSGVWHLPDGAAEAGLVLAHGAGGNMHAPFLRALADALAARALAVVRFNFPYSEAGRKTPDRQPVAEACYRAVLEQAHERVPHLYAGGKSYGGRMASHVAAAGAPAAGLVFVGYPLHPPGKPERLRDAHLGAIPVPMLFLQGTRDSFARLDLVSGVTERLAGATLHLVDGGDHSFKVPGRPAREVVDELARATAEWIAGQPR